MKFALFSFPDGYFLEYGFECGLIRAFERKQDYFNNHQIIVIGLSNSGFYKCEYNKSKRPTTHPIVNKKIINNCIRKLKGMK